MNHLLGSIDSKRNLQVVFEELDREYLVSKVIWGFWGEILISRTWAKKLGISNQSFFSQGGGISNILYFHPLPGEMIQFHEHMFQIGWVSRPSCEFWSEIKYSFSHNRGLVKNCKYSTWKGTTIIAGTLLFHWITIMGGRVYDKGKEPLFPEVRV